MVSTNDSEVVSELPIATEVASNTTDVIRSISDEEFEKAQKTFQSGKKNLFLNKYDESVNNIGEACKIYSTKFGEFDPQCADVYFFYGRALLELARVENTVLGNALNGVPEDTGPIDDSRYGNPEEVAAEEKQEISEKVIDALCNRETETNGNTATDDAPVPAATTTTTTTETTATTETTKETTTETEKVDEKIEAATTVTESKSETPTENSTTTTTTAAVDEAEISKPIETEKSTENGKKEGDEPVTAEAEKKEGDEAEEDDEEGDDVEGEEEDGEDLTKNDEQVKDEAEAEEISNLQRSWEMFELAKLVYTKHFDNDLSFKNKRIAECLLKLGEISIEQEIYDQAITDIKESVRLQEELKEERDERMLAESFYQLGLAQQFNNFFSEANESYQKSINIMQLRIEKLKAKLETLKSPTQSIDATSESVANEIKTDGAPVDSNKQTTNTSSDASDIELERNTIKDEIAELEALVPDLQAKLEEVNEQGQQSLNLIKEAKECFLNSAANENGINGASSTLNGSSSTNGDVKDITNMVKSKRKINEVTDEGSNIKKTRLSGSDDIANNVAATENENKKETSVNGEAEPIKVDEPEAAVPVSNPVETAAPTPIETA